MRATLKAVLMILFCLSTALSYASTEQSPWFSKAEDSKLRLRADLFITSTCSHCQDADAFLRQLQQEKPWLEVHRYVINQDKAALEQFRQELKQHHLDDYSVPALFFCNSWWVGFDKAETTGEAISRGLDYCYAQISKTGNLTPETTTVLKQWANSGTIGQGLIKISNPAVFIPLVASLDILTSCSIFCVLALFAFLWLHREKSVMLGLGLFFIVMVFVVHYFQQSFNVFFYQILAELRIPAALVGLGLIAYVLVIYSKGRNLRLGFTIPILAGLTALIIEAYQQTCMPNYSLVFTHWLDIQDISLLQRKFYSLLYHFIYVLPLLLIMAILTYCRVNQKLEQLKPFLFYLAWCLLLIIGLIFVVYPKGLSNLALSLLTLLVSLIAAWVTARGRIPKASS